MSATEFDKDCCPEPPKMVLLFNRGDNYVTLPATFYFYLRLSTIDWDKSYGLENLFEVCI